MDTWEKMAGDDGRSAARWTQSGHKALKHLLVLVVITSKSLQQIFEAYLYSQSQLWILQADKVTCIKQT